MFEKYYRNAGRPKGLGGRIMINRMNGGRHAALAEWGLSHISPAPDAYVLEAGCGGGANVARLLELCPEGRVLGLDRSPVSVKTSRRVNAKAIKNGRCRIVCGDVAAMTFDNDLFDLATAFETVYFWPVRDAFSEVLRVLRPGGTFFVCNEADGENVTAEKMTKIIGGMTVYTAAELTGLLSAAGFCDIKTYGDPDKGWLCASARKPERIEQPDAII